MDVGSNMVGDPTTMSDAQKVQHLHSAFAVFMLSCFQS
jgi:hypothetical protein